MTVLGLEFSYLSQSLCSKPWPGTAVCLYFHLVSSPRPSSCSESRMPNWNKNREYKILHISCGFPLATLPLTRVGKLGIPLFWLTGSTPKSVDINSKGLLHMAPTAHRACHSHPSGSNGRDGFSPKAWSRARLPSVQGHHSGAWLGDTSPHVAVRKSMVW